MLMPHFVDSARNVGEWGNAECDDDPIQRPRRKREIWWLCCMLHQDQVTAAYVSIVAVLSAMSFLEDAVF